MSNPLDYMSQRELNQVSLGMVRPEIEFDPFIVTEEDNKEIQEAMGDCTNGGVKRLNRVLNKYCSIKTIVDEKTFYHIINNPNIKMIYLSFQSMFKDDSMGNTLFYNNGWIMWRDE